MTGTRPLVQDIETLWDMLGDVRGILYPDEDDGGSRYGEAFVTSTVSWKNMFLDHAELEIIVPLPDPDDDMTGRAPDGMPGL